MNLPFLRRAKVCFSLLATFSLIIPSFASNAQAQQNQGNTIVSLAPGQIAPPHPLTNKFKVNNSGSLSVIGPKGKVSATCPLKHTAVSAQVSGYVSRVTVKQLFSNPFKDKIEAVYTFPLSETGAVDDMLMKVGTRTIHGTINRREEARRIYEEARSRGNVASLLDQERPNIFTQSVANINPGESVEITLQYVDLLPYDSGSFSFIFPTVVGPRFNPGTPIGHEGTGFSPDTTEVPDASRITPAVTPKGTRAGHDISLEVAIDAGIPIQQISSKLHEVSINRPSQNRVVVSLKNQQTIPNKDFVLTWDVATDQLQSGYLTHNNGKSGFFTLMLLPPKRVTPKTAAPKEMIFLIDCSGSQSGAPLQKAKETLNYILSNMNPQDTMQIISFSDHLTVFPESPQQANDSMRHQARQFIASLSANGGTWMAPAVEKACTIAADAHRLRIVTFMTDGYVGNDFEILGMVRKLRGTSRWFPFGTGNSVNRLLIDGMAKEGGGEPEYVLLNSSGAEVGKKFYDRISSPVLTDVKIDFGTLDVKEVFPYQVSDVWAQKPLYIKGRYTKPGKGVVTLTGFAGGKPYQQKLEVTLPAKQDTNEVLGSLWARAKVDRLMSEDYFGAQRGEVNKELKEEIVRVALTHHIMTQYTSFVAVEETVITDGGKPRTVAVPVEMPEGVSYEGVFGEGKRNISMRQTASARYSGQSLMARTPTSSGAHYYKGYAGGGAGSSSIAPSPYIAACPARINPLPCPTAKSSAQADMSSEEALDHAISKLAPALQGLSAKLASLGDKAKLNGIEIYDGKVTVKVWLSNYSEKTIKQLKEIGLEIIFQATSTNMIIGRIEVAKLDNLAKLDTVRLIAPGTTP